MKNRYWMIHWWEIFKTLDELCLNLAIEKIWHSLTSNANINYFHPIYNLEDFEISLKILNQTNSTIIIEAKINSNKENKIFVSSTFTFVKCKDCKISQ